ncbi:MAG: hypothetical protein ACOY9D_09890 [Pseudomonadota bacterium]
MQEPVTDTKDRESVANFELREITEMLVKHLGLHEGLYDLSFEFQIGVGGIGPDPSSALPGAMFGIRRIGIINSNKQGTATVDAAKINPISAAKAVAPKKPANK